MSYAPVFQFSVLSCKKWNLNTTFIIFQLSEWRGFIFLTAIAICKITLKEVKLLMNAETINMHMLKLCNHNATNYSRTQQLLHRTCLNVWICRCNFEHIWIFCFTFQHCQSHSHFALVDFYLPCITTWT